MIRIDTELRERMSRLLALTIVAALSGPTLAGAPRGAPPFTIGRDDQYGDMKPAPPLPPEAVSSAPPVVRLGDIGRRQRESFALPNDPATVAEAERATSLRLHRGIDKVGVPLTDAEFAQFEVWKRLVDEPSMDKAMAEHQNEAAEKRVSPVLGAPQVELWVLPAAPHRSDILASVPVGSTWWSVTHHSREISSRPSAQLSRTS